MRLDLRKDRPCLLGRVKDSSDYTEPAVQQRFQELCMTDVNLSCLGEAACFGRLA